MGLSWICSGSETSNPLKILGNVFIAFIGAGILGLPYAFKEAGIIEGTVLMILLAVLSVRSMLLLLECKYHIIAVYESEDHQMGMKEDGLFSYFSGSGEETHDLLKEEGNLFTRIKDFKPFVSEDLSYGDIGYESLGAIGRLLVDLVVVLSQIGFSCAYLIFICRNLSHFLPSVEMAYWLIILLPPLSLLTLFRNLNSLAVTSILAQCANLFAFSIVFWFDFHHAANVSLHPREMALENLPYFAVIAIYCYEGAGLVLPLESSLVKEVRPQFNKYFISTLVGITVLYITFGICGYLSFGPDTNQIITLNLPHGDGFSFAAVVKSCMCFALFLTYPVMMFPVMKILEHYFIIDADRAIWKGNVLRGLVVLVTGVVVIMIPNFADLMAVVGASCCTLTVFILPAAFHLKLHKGLLTKKQMVLDWFIICVGIAGAIFGLWDAIRRSSVVDIILEITTPSTAGTSTLVSNNVTTHVSQANTSDFVSAAMTSITTTTKSVTKSLVQWKFQALTTTLLPPINNSSLT
ncbi:amino acid transporter ANTL1 [Biomphalaria glabrata]|nr:amino acid transporter ANTL1 [Biomphalaria glabrata]